MAPSPGTVQVCSHTKGRKSIPSSRQCQKASKPPKGTAAARTTRRAMHKAACTHTVMVRVYGWDLRCHMCNRYSILGFMYECEQDQVNAPHHKTFTVRKKPQRGKKRRAPNDLEALGFHPTVVQGVKAGNYTKEQVDTIKAQKLAARKIIEEALEKEESSQSHQVASPGAFNDFPKSFGKKDDSKSGKASNHIQPLPCKFRVCHNCRPYSRDRTFITTETAFKEEYFFPSEWEPATMPVHDRDMVREFGLRPAVASALSRPATPLTTLTSSHTASSMENNYDESEAGDLGTMKRSTMPSSLWQRLRARRSSENLKELAEDHAEGSKGFRESIKNAMLDLLRRATLTSPGSSRVQELTKKLEQMNTEEKVDMELWKQLTDELLEIAAAVPLPNENDADVADLLQPVDDGEEVDGVALTEEAVENEAPDLIASV